MLISNETSTSTHKPLAINTTKSTISGVPGIFSMVVLKKYKLYNQIKREIYILTPTTIKKHANSYMNEHGV